MAYKELDNRYGVDATPLRDFLCDTEEDRESVPTDIAAGSTVYVAETKKKYILNNAHVWCEM